MKWILPLLLLVIGWSFSCWGQDVGTQLLPQVASKEMIRGEFRQERHISVLSLPLISTGAFTYRKKGGLIWQTLTPIENRIEINTSLGVLSGKDESNLRIVAHSQLLAEIFLDVFSGDFDPLARLFRIEEESVMKPAESDLENSSDGVVGKPWRLLLTPVKSSLGAHIVSIQLQGKECVETIMLQEANGDRTEIHLNVLELH